MSHLRTDGTHLLKTTGGHLSLSCGSASCTCADSPGSSAGITNCNCWDLQTCGVVSRYRTYTLGFTHPSGILAGGNLTYDGGSATAPDVDIEALFFDIEESYDGSCFRQLAILGTGDSPLIEVVDLGNGYEGVLELVSTGVGYLGLRTYFRDSSTLEEVAGDNQEMGISENGNPRCVGKAWTCSPLSLSSSSANTSWSISQTAWFLGTASVPTRPLPYAFDASPAF